MKGELGEEVMYFFPPLSLLFLLLHKSFLIFVESH